jgi:hypothetical protein
MNKILLNPAAVKAVLVSKNVDGLYHANTVATACTFLKNGGLLSREAVERAGLIQTPQYTDAIDKTVGVWGDVFLDTFDIHSELDNLNYYGPVLFKFSLNILDRVSLPDLRITKTNPKGWDITGLRYERYFQTIDELKSSFQRSSPQQMVTLRKGFGVLAFHGDLVSIIVDDPQRRVDGTNPYADALAKLQNAAIMGGINVAVFQKRTCAVTCQCKTKYAATYNATMKKYYTSQ